MTTPNHITKVTKIIEENMDKHNRKHDREQELGQRLRDKNKERQDDLLNKLVPHHTPVPWHNTVEDNPENYGDSIASADRELITQCSYKLGWDTAKANAAFIVTAVNAHDKLVEALREIALGRGPHSRDSLTHAENVIDAMKAVAEQALKKAGEA